MTQKIKLMSDEEIDKLLFTGDCFDHVLGRYSHDDVFKKMKQTRDECEKRAFEKVKDAFSAGWASCYQSENPEFQSSTVFASADEASQQFLKEQDGE